MAKEKELDLSGFDEEIAKAEPSAQEEIDISTFDTETPVEPIKVQLDIPEIDQDLMEAAQPLTDTDISKLKSFGMGTAQGGTLGFADELTAGVKAPFTDKTYRQELESLRDAFRQAQEANPISYGAGQLTGGVASSLFPGMAAIKATKGAGALAKIGTAGLEGAKFGALTGLGTSEQSDIPGMARDTLTGAEIGLGTGLVLGAGAEGTKKLVSTLAKTQTAQDLLDAYRLATQGKDLTQESARKALVEQEIKKTNELVSTLEKSRSAIGKEMAASAKAAKEQGVAINSADLLSKAEDILNTPGISDSERKSLEATLNKFTYEKAPTPIKVKEVQSPKGLSTTVSGKDIELSQLPESLDELEKLVPTSSSKKVAEGALPEQLPSETFTTQRTGIIPGIAREQLDAEQVAELMKEIGALESIYQRRAGGPSALPADKQVANKLSALYSNLKEESKKAMPDYSQLSAKYRDVVNTIDDLGGISPDKRASDLLQAEPKALQFTMNMGELSPAQVQKENLVRKGLEQGIGEQPASELFKGLSQAAREGQLARKMGAEIPEIGMTATGVPRASTGLLKRIGLGGAAKIGTTKKVATDLLTSPNFYIKSSAKLAQKGFNELSNLMKYAADQNPTQRAATMFMIKSDPAYREQLQELEDEEQQQIDTSTEDTEE